MVDLPVAIVGTGALGESLALSIKRAGGAVHCIISRDVQRARTLAQKVEAPFSVKLGDNLPAGIQLVFLCVPDDAIAPTGRLLAEVEYLWADVWAAHTSGALTANALRPLSLVGARVFSFHPVQTFTKERDSEWSDIFVGIEGEESGVHIGKQVAALLGSIPLLLNAEDKALYHASAVVASNFIVALIGIAADILNQIQVSREDATALLAPLIERTCQNIVASGPERALTGPASRGDIQTIKRHAEALGNSVPDRYHIYLQLTKEAIDLKLRNDPSFKRIASNMHQEIERLIRSNESR